jgi:hypothetical protein
MDQTSLQSSINVNRKNQQKEVIPYVNNLTIMILLAANG